MGDLEDVSNYTIGKSSWSDRPLQILASLYFTVLRVSTNGTRHKLPHIRVRRYVGPTAAVRNALLPRGHRFTTAPSCTRSGVRHILLPLLPATIPDLLSHPPVCTKYNGPTVCFADVLPARRRYASAGTIAMALCLSVSVSVRDCPTRCSVGVLSKGMDGLTWFSAWRLLSTSPALCSKEI